MNHKLRIRWLKKQIPNFNLYILKIVGWDKIILKLIISNSREIDTIQFRY